MTRPSALSRANSASSKPPVPQLEAVQAGLARLASVASEYGMTAGYHNHSGAGYIGGPIWDLYYMIHKIGSPHFGSNLDAGHITAGEVRISFEAPVTEANVTYYTTTNVAHAIGTDSWAYDNDDILVTLPGGGPPDLVAGDIIRVIAAI